MEFGLDLEGSWNSSLPFTFCIIKAFVLNLPYFARSYFYPNSSLFPFAILITGRHSACFLHITFSVFLAIHINLDLVGHV